MILYILYLLLVVPISCSGRPNNSPIAFEATQFDLAQFKDYCSQFDIETGTLVAQWGKLPNLFYRLNIKCHRRLVAHRFLWVDASYAEKFQKSAIHILERKTEDSMRNLANPIDRNVKDIKAYVLVEIIPKTLSRAIKIKKLKAWRRQTHRAKMRYRVERKADKVVIKNEKTICINFQAYYQLKTKGKVDIGDIGNSLCYKVSEDVIVPKEILKIGAPLEHIHAQKEQVVFEAEVELMVQASNKVTDVLKIPAMIKEDKIAEGTISLT